MFDLLPKELCDDIFLRLPIKNLASLACTCKTLFNFIINPNFMNAHNKKSKDNPFILLRYVDDKCKDEPFKRGSSKTREKEYFCLRQDDESFSGHVLRKLDFPIQDRCNRCFNIVGSCNGVVCLSDDLEMYSGIIYLWNRSIRRYKKLPYPKVDVGSHGPYDLCVGFGFDQFTNDYKVVRLVYPEIDEITPFPRPLVVEVYSLNSDSWKPIEDSESLYCIRRHISSMKMWKEPYSQCFLNGVVHWAGYKEDGGCWGIIVTFDVHQECLGDMKLPACLEGLSEGSVGFNVAVCWDMLALVHLPQRCPDYKCSACIWVMEEYGNVDSWSVLFRLDDPAIYLVPRAFYFRKNNDILILASGWRQKLGRFICNSEGNFYLRIFAIGNGRDCNTPKFLFLFKNILSRIKTKIRKFRDVTPHSSQRPECKEISKATV